jgi:hypothetical protein
VTEASWRILKIETTFSKPLACCASDCAAALASSTSAAFCCVT